MAKSKVSVPQIIAKYIPTINIRSGSRHYYRQAESPSERSNKYEKLSLTPAAAHQIAEIIRKHIYPNPLILDTHDLAAAYSSEDLQLPWQEDGFHIPITVRRNRSGRNPQKAVARMSQDSPRVSFTTVIDLADLEKGELKW